MIQTCSLYIYTCVTYGLYKLSTVYRSFNNNEYSFCLWHFFLADQFQFVSFQFNLMEFFFFFFYCLTFSIYVIVRPASINIWKYSQPIYFKFSHPLLQLIFDLIFSNIESEHKAHFPDLPRIVMLCLTRLVVIFCTCNIRLWVFDIRE